MSKQRHPRLSAFVPLRVVYISWLLCPNKDIHVCRLVFHYVSFKFRGYCVQTKTSTFVVFCSITCRLNFVATVSKQRHPRLSSFVPLRVVLISWLLCPNKDIHVCRLLFHYVLFKFRGYCVQTKTSTFVGFCSITCRFNFVATVSKQRHPRLSAFVPLRVV